MLAAAQPVATDPSTWPILAEVWLGLLVVLFVGSIVSFLGVVVERTRAGESIFGRSHCVCGRTLAPYELVPVFSWLVLALTRRLRTSCCGSRVPVIYGATEGGCAVWAILLVFTLGLSWTTLVGVLAGIGVAVLFLFRNSSRTAESASSGADLGAADDTTGPAADG